MKERQRESLIVSVGTEGEGVVDREDRRRRSEHERHWILTTLPHHLWCLRAQFSSFKAESTSVRASSTH